MGYIIRRCSKWSGLSTKPHNPVSNQHALQGHIQILFLFIVYYQIKRIFLAFLLFLHDEEQTDMVKVMIAIFKRFVANVPQHSIEEFVVTEKKIK